MSNEREGAVTLKGNPVTLVGPELKVGDIIWQVQNLHVYERHFHLVK